MGANTNIPDTTHINSDSMQVDVMIDCLVHGAARIDLGDVSARRLLSKKR